MCAESSLLPQCSGREGVKHPFGNTVDCYAGVAGIDWCITVPCIDLYAGNPHLVLLKPVVLRVQDIHQRPYDIVGSKSVESKEGL